MPDLNFEVEWADPLLYSVAPQLVFKLADHRRFAGPSRLRSRPSRCDARSGSSRPAGVRCGGTGAASRPFRRAVTLGPDARSLLWTQTRLVVPPFKGTTLVDLPVPCTYDFNVAATKYFYALEEGEVPLCLLFSGTIFYADEEGGPLQVSPISWEKETAFRLPVPVWKEMMDLYYPNSAWLCLRRDVFDQLYRYKSHADCRPGSRRWMPPGRRAEKESRHEPGLVDRIAGALLYEGYLLYPYRPSVKNRHRWTFGGLYPPAYAAPVRHPTPR